MAERTDFDSPYYPYRMVQTGFSSFLGWEDIPGKIVRYLLDLPDSFGYEPRDDNERPRVRLAKLLWNDGARPLSGPLPTAKEKLSMLFDAEHPVLNTDEERAAHPKGYRLFAQNNIGQSQLEAETIIFCYLGREVPYNDFQSRVAVCFDIWCNTNLETNTKTEHYNRTAAIEQAIKQALNGVNITGVGTMQYSRSFHADCGSTPLYDAYTNTGRRLTMALTWMDGGENAGEITEN